MLRIRLQRTGRRNQVAYRIVVAEHSAPVQGRVVARLGMYNPSENKKIVFDAAAIEAWIGKGAKPTDTVASLLKAKGMKGMDAYITRPRDLKREVRDPEKEQNQKKAPQVEEAPAEEEVAAVVEETPETPVEEAAAPAEEAETPVQEEAPAAEEAPAEESAETPAEESAE